MAPPRKRPAKLDAEAEALLASSRIEKVKLDVLKIDRTYQRDPSPSLVEVIADDYDVIASELLLVSDRGPRPKDGDVEGGLFLVNGQHRSLAARSKGITEADARIINLRKVADPGKIEAGFRLKTNVGLQDRATERFKAQLRAGNEESIAIDKIVRAVGTEIQYDQAVDFGILAVSSLESIFRYDDTGGLLQETLETIRDAYGFVDKARSAAMLKGMAWFVASHSDKVDRGRLLRQLNEANAAVIDRRARTFQSTLGSSLWFNYYRAIVDAYNERLRDSQRLQFVTRGALKLARRGNQLPENR